MAGEFVPSGVELIARNLGGFLRDLATADSAIARVGVGSAGSIVNVGKGFATLGSSIANVGVQAATAAAVGIAALGAGLATVVATGVSKAADLDQQMANIAATMNKTKGEVGPLKDLIFDLALDPNLKVTTTEAADAIEKLTKNGITMQEVLDGAAASTVALANATGAQFNTAAEIASSVMKNYKLDADELGVAIDGITGVTTNSKFTIDDYALAFAQSGAVAANLGVGIDDLNTVLAGTATAFSSGSDAGTSLKALLLRLSAPTDENKAAMDKYGISLFDSTGKMRSMGELVGQFNKVMHGTVTTTETVGGATKKQAAAAATASKNIAGLTAGIDTNQKQLQLYNDQLALEMQYYGEGSPKVRQRQLQIEKLTNTINGQQQKLGDYEAAIAAVDGAQAQSITTTEQLTEAERAQLAETIGGMDAARLLLSLSNMTQKQFETLSDKVNDSGQAFRSAATRMDSAKGAMEIFWGIVDAVQIKIGEEFLPIVKDMTFAFIDWSEEAGPAVIGFFSELADSVKDGIAWIGMLSARFKKFGAAGLFAGLGFEGTALFFKKLGELFNMIMGDATTLSDTINTTVGATFTWLGENVFPLMTQGLQFIMDHFAEFQGALTGIGVAAVFGLIAAAIAALLGPITLIVGAAALLGAAWAGNWGGIQEKTAAVWAAVQPILTNMATWLMVNIPIAMQAVSDFWTTTLAPALLQLGEYITTSIIPAITDLAGWLGTNAPIAIQFLADTWTNILWPAIMAFADWLTGTWFPLQDQWWTYLTDMVNNAIAPLAAAWTNVLLPALTGIWSFINTSLMPVWVALVDLLGAVVGKAVEALAGYWQNLLLPGLEDVWEFIQANILPMFEDVGATVNDDVIPPIETFTDTVLPPLKKALNFIQGLLKDLTGTFTGWATVVRNFELPAVLQRHSPSPFEQTLAGVAEQAGLAAAAMGNFDQATIDALLGVKRNIADTHSIIGAARDDLEKFFKGKNVERSKADLALRSLNTLFHQNAAEILAATDRAEKFREIIGRSGVSFTFMGQGGGVDVFTDNSAVKAFISAFDKRKIELEKAQRNIFIEAGRTALSIGQRLNGIVEGSAEILDERVAALKELVKSGLEEVNFEGQIISATAAQELLNAALADQRDIQDDLLQLRQNEAKLGFLEKQLDLVKTLNDAGLDVQDILGGISLGLDASIPDMIAATNALVQAMIEQIDRDLQIASPSRVMFGKGEQAGEGMEMGWLASIPGIQTAFQQAMQVGMTMDRPLPMPINNISVMLDSPTGMQSPTQNNFNMTVETGANPQAVIQQYEVMRSMLN